MSSPLENTNTESLTVIGIWPCSAPATTTYFGYKENIKHRTGYCQCINDIITIILQPNKGKNIRMSRIYISDVLLYDNLCLSE